QFAADALPLLPERLVCFFAPLKERGKCPFLVARAQKPLKRIVQLDRLFIERWKRAGLSRRSRSGAGKVKFSEQRKIGPRLIAQGQHGPNARRPASGRLIAAR